ncbi:MAG: Ku protein [Clostridia bacterium]|nr:Ku protein [Clostridia bacterium]
MAYSYKGAIAFGLVYIPITLSICVKEHNIGFNMLEKKTKSRVKYKKTCVDCNNKEVKNEDIVKGYQYEKDKYVIFTDKDFEKLKTPKDKNITIEKFVDVKEVDPIYYDKAYYVKPGGADKAYNVLLKAMQEQNKVAIAKTVLGTKETLILIRAIDGKMIVFTLYFKSEIQKAPANEASKITKKELDLAKNLINQMTGKFEPEKYKDEYYEKVKKAIKRKINGNEIVEAKFEAEPVKIINLMEALQKSLVKKEKGDGGKSEAI